MKIKVLTKVEFTIYSNNHFILSDISTLPFTPIRYEAKIFEAFSLGSPRIQLDLSWHGDSCRCIGLHLYQNLAKDPLRWVPLYSPPSLIFLVILIIKVVKIYVKIIVLLCLRENITLRCHFYFQRFRGSSEEDERMWGQD